MGYAETHLRCS